MKATRFIFLVVLIISGSFFAEAQSQIKNTKHNLSVSGPGEYKSMEETRICIFCHTPHTSQPKKPLWNHDLSAVTNYIIYRSPTFDAPVVGTSAITIDGDSKLCLSCHDGTVALGAIGKRGARSGLRARIGNLPPTAKGYIGIDLSGSHPISFRVTEALIAANNAKDTPLRSLAAMKADPDVRLDRNNKVQCTSCHDVHSDKNFASSGIHFWAKPTFNEVCSGCHIF